MVYLSLDKAYIAAGESFKLGLTDATPDASSPSSYSYTITGEGVTTDHFVGETSLSGNIQLGVNNTGFKTFVTTADFPAGDNSLDLTLSSGSTSVTLKVYSSNHYQTLNTKIDLTDTFDTWRKKTNSFVARLDSLESGTSDIKAQTLIGNGISDTYVLNFQVVGANPYFFDINIDGITQNPFDAYTIDGTSNSIVFTDTPPADSVISVLHKFAIGATFKEITEDFDVGGTLRVGEELFIDTQLTNVNVGTTLTDFGSRINQLEDETATVQTMTITAAGGTTSSYVLGFTVDTENPYFFHVNIDGITQNPADAYTITESSNTIVFSEVPPTDSVISIIHHSFTEITNDLSVAGDVFVTDKITHTGDENTSLRFPADDTVAIETDGVERLRVNSTGEIGIGKTATTGVELDVNGNIVASGTVIGATPTENTHLTTKSYVDTAVAGIVDSAPEALNTLNEIAEALNDSPGQIDNILTAVGERLVIANNLSDLNNTATARTNLGLGNVDDTTDAGKPVSSAQQTALNLKADKESPTFTGNILLENSTNTNKTLIKQKSYGVNGSFQLQRGTSSDESLSTFWEGSSAENLVIRQYFEGNQEGQIKFLGDTPNGSNTLRLDAKNIDVGFSNTDLTKIFSNTNIVSNKKLVFTDTRTNDHGLQFNHSGASELVQMGMYGSYGDSNIGEFKITHKIGASANTDVLSIAPEAAKVTIHKQLNIKNILVFADNTAANAGGLLDGDVYRTSTGELRIFYS